MRRCAPEAGAAEIFVVGDGRHVSIAFVRGAEITLSAPFAAHVPPPARSDRLADRRVALLCESPSQLSIVYLGAADQLLQARCRSSERSCEMQPLAEGVLHFASVATPQGSVLAVRGNEGSPQIRILRADRDGRFEPAAITPGPCWEGWGGMCGSPELVRLGSRIVLSAVSGADVMVLESPDAGRTWQPLGASQLLQPPGPQVLPRALRP